MEEGRKGWPRGTKVEGFSLLSGRVTFKRFPALMPADLFPSSYYYSFLPTNLLLSFPRQCCPRVKVNSIVTDVYRRNFTEGCFERNSLENDGKVDPLNFEAIRRHALSAYRVYPTRS